MSTNVETSDKSKNRIYSLNAFRFILAVLILLSHAGKIANVGEPKLVDLYFNAFNNGGGIVTIFFVLSGFLMTIGYHKRFEKLTVKSYFDFLKKRLLKFYPLYSVCMIFVFLYYYGTSGWDICFVKENILSLILALAMVQTLTVKYILVLNAVGWFMSVMFLIYLVVPFLIHLFNKLKNRPIWYLILAILFYLLSTFVAHGLCYVLLQRGPDFEAYISPIVDQGPYAKIFQYCAGMMIAYWFMFVKEETHLKNETLTFSILEFLVIALFVMVSIIDMQIVNHRTFNDVYNVPFAMLFVFIFAFDRGIISKFLSVKPMQALGNVSMEFYLIHYIPAYKLGFNDICYEWFKPMGPFADCFFMILVWIGISLAFAFTWNIAQKHILNWLFRSRRKRDLSTKQEAS